MINEFWQWCIHRSAWCDQFDSWLMRRWPVFRTWRMNQDAKAVRRVADVANAIAAPGGYVEQHRVDWIMFPRNQPPQLTGFVDMNGNVTEFDQTSIPGVVDCHRRKTSLDAFRKWTAKR